MPKKKQKKLTIQQIQILYKSNLLRVHRFVLRTCVWQSLVVLLGGHFQVGLVVGHQLQLADLGPGVGNLLWYLKHQAYKIRRWV